MMKRVLSIVMALLAVSAAPRAQADVATLANQVREAERAFAKTMADRDHNAFASFLADEAVFFSETGVLRGKAAVASGWKRLYDGPGAPFSWDPDRVEVLDSGRAGAEQRTRPRSAREACRNVQLGVAS